MVLSATLDGLSLMGIAQGIAPNLF